MQLGWAGPQNIQIAISSRPSNLNPFFSTDSNSQNIGRLVHLSLIDFDAEMKVKCHLCESFSESFKNGKHQIIFQLKKGIEFWDEQEIKSQDVMNAIRLFQTENKAIKSIFRFAFNKINRVKIINEYKILLEYKKFSLENISNLPLLKIIRLKKSLPHYKKVSTQDIIGAGSYSLGKIAPFSIELIPMDKKRPLLVFKVVKDKTTLALKFINEEIDLSVSDISPRKLKWIQQNSFGKIKIIQKQSTIYRYIAFNHKKDIFKHREVRRALSLLIPRKDLLRYKLKGTADLSFGLFSRAFKGQYYESQIDQYNPGEAEKLLDLAGFPRNKDNIRFSLNWKSTNDRSILEIVEVIKHYFSKAGINIRIITQEWGTFMKSIKSGNYDIYTSQWIGFTGPDMLRYLFHSESFPPKGANRGFYVNKQVDHLLDLATNEIKFKKRNKYYIETQKIIASDYPYINLWHPKINWIARSCIYIDSLYSNASFFPLLNIKKSCDNT